MSDTRIILMMSSAENNNPAFDTRECVNFCGTMETTRDGCFKAAGAINDWLARHDYHGRFACKDAGMFILSNPSDREPIDLDLFMVHLHMLPWAQPEDVQIFYKGPHHSRYQLWELKLDYFRDVQNFLASAEARKPEVRAMIENAILLQREGQPELTRKIRRDTNLVVPVDTQERSP